ncbi:MAG: type I secretion system permease/ATPase [Rhodospirillales bacterium]
MAEIKANPLKVAVRECAGALPIVAVVSMFINILLLVSPLYMMQTFDRVLGSGRVETLVLLTLIAGIAVLVMGLLFMVRGKILARISRWLERKLSTELIKASMRATLYGLPPSSQSLHDLGMLKSFLTGNGVNTILDAPWVPIFLLVIWLLHPVLGLLGVGTAIVLLVIALLNEIASRKALRESSQMSIANMQKAGLAIRNADVFHAMGMLPGFLTQWSKRNDQGLDLYLKASDHNAAFLGISKFVRMFAQMLVLGVGAYLVLQSELTSGGMIAGSILLGRALAPVDQAIGAWKSMVAARDSYERLQKILDRIPEVEAHMPLPAPKGQLSCEQVIFVPPGRMEPVLQGIHFSLPAGEALGIIGPSAAGKSTLCKILIGTWQPTRGRARLDGADIFTWHSDQVGPYIGYLPQDVELFGGTVKDNIGRLLPDPDPDEVVEAAIIAGVHDMILRLPGGYETEIGEAGAFLSGGQRQRIGLARALYGKPKLIVLDEPNASLDAEGEEALIGAMDTAKGWGATVIIVAHQPRILRPVDKLLVLRDGRMEMFGPRDEVIAKLRPKPVNPAPPAQRAVGRQPAPAPTGAAGE